LLVFEAFTEVVVWFDL